MPFNDWQQQPLLPRQFTRLGPGTNRAMGSRLTSSSYNLNGMLDEFRIYNRALTDAEVVLVYRATFAGRGR